MRSMHMHSIEDIDAYAAQAGTLIGMLPCPSVRDQHLFLCDVMNAAVQDKSIKRMPATLAQLHKQATDTADRLKALRALQPSYLRYQALQNQV